MNYVLHLLVYFEIYVIVALSLNLVLGYCGLLTLAHAAYFALGGYAYAVLTTAWNLSFAPALAFAVLIGAIVSVALSVPAWRLRGDFFVMASLAAQALLYSLFYNWFDSDAALGTIRNLTNGPFGISAIPRPGMPGVGTVALPGFLVLTTGAMLVSLSLVWRLTSSPWGRVLISMRDDELAARGLGKNTRVLKLQAIAIACGLAALAGALYASYVGYLDPSAGSLDHSILMLSMVLVGGVGNLRGPIIGAAILVLLPELLRFVNLPDAQAANLRLAIYGLLLILMMHLRPKGIAGNYEVA